MHPHHQPSPSPQPTPTKVKPINKKREGEVDAGEELGDARLAGVNVTQDDLLALVEELGLGGDEANDLVRGLTGGNSRSALSPSTKKSNEKPKDGPLAKKEDESVSKEQMADDKTKVKATDCPVLESTLAEESSTVPTEKPADDT